MGRRGQETSPNHTVVIRNGGNFRLGGIGNVGISCVLQTSSRFVRPIKKGARPNNRSLEIRIIASSKLLKSFGNVSPEKTHPTLQFDSETVVRQTYNYNSNWWVANGIQTGIERGMEEGWEVRVIWEKKGGVENREVDDGAKRITMEGEEEEGERIGRCNKRDMRMWRREREMEIWQELWDEGETRRRLYRVWGRVRRRVGKNHSAVTQVATGHGGVREYLARFGLGEGGDV